METFNAIMAAINDVLWHEYVLYVVVGVGILFTIWSKFSQWRAVSHGTAVVRGKYDDPNDPGAINHFQALSTALSATVGLGNIGGVAIAMALGGPGALFWMWVIGLLGMAIKTTEVTLSMIYRNVDDPDEPHGGPMWVAKRGFAEMSPGLATFGKIVGGIFCVTLLISAVTGGNMFQAWNVADITYEYFSIPKELSGVVLAVVVAMVLIGGIKRIGKVTGSLVPFMCLLYIVTGLYVIAINIGDVPAMFMLIFEEAFSPTEASGAFLGGGAGAAFIWGMKRALFSSEAGQGSSPIAHSAAKTDEPVREGVVAGLEPFIDTIIVCTITALVLLLTGTWNHSADVNMTQVPALEQVQDAENTWTLPTMPLPAREGNPWRSGDTVFAIAKGDSDTVMYRIDGDIVEARDADVGSGFDVDWGNVTLPPDAGQSPVLRDGGIYVGYQGATMTARAFDKVHDGLGKWLITIASWLFAISTIIAWGYYGEQGIVYLFGDRGVMPYKVIYCGLVVITTMGFINTTQELDNLTSIGTGVMLLANIPIMLIFGHKAMSAYQRYIGRLKSGELDAEEHAAPPMSELPTGKDVEK